MPDTILHKRNLTPGVAPTTESLSVGELAINVADRKLYTRSGSAIVILNDNTGSFTGSFTGEFIGTASFATSASYAPTILPSGVISSSAQVTASISGSIITPSLISQSNFEGYAVVAHRYLELYPTDVDVAGGADPDSAYFYISGSNNDLWYTHKTDSTVNFDWIEGVLETGLIHGGINGFNGSEVHIRSGSGIIVNHGANTGSASSPTVTYVQWPVITGSIDVTQGFVTYLAINANGILESSSTKFTSLDYHDKIPLGAVGHFNQQAIAAKGEQVNTQYSQTAQLTDFARNFGPIKVGGYGITAQSGSLKFSRAAGDAFIYGGFYSQNPETPSNFQSTSVSTGSLAYIYRSGSAYTVDANNNNFYTDLKPGWYDDGGLTTASLASNEWSIQRVFIEPVTGIHYIYFGQAKYTSLANAVSNILTDPFAEGPATTLFTVFVGYLVMKGDTTNLADTGSNDIISAGLFRNTSAGSVGGGAAAQLLNDLSDVTVTSPSNGQALIYSSGNWINGVPQDAVSASYATSGSYTITASFATSASFATTSSAATSITFIPSTASFSTTSSFASTAQNGFPFSGSAVITGSLELSRLYNLPSFAENVTRSVVLNNNSDFPLIITGSGRSGGFAPAGIRAELIDGSTGTEANIRFNATGDGGLQGNLLIGVDGDVDDIPYGNIRYDNGPLFINATRLLNGGMYINTPSSSISLTEAGVTIYGSPEVTPSIVVDSGGIGLFGNLFVSSSSHQITGSLLISSSVSAPSFTSSLNNQVGFFGTSSFAVSSSQAVTSSFATTASFATTSSFATTASFAPYTGLRTKAGSVANTSFTGNPKKATVTFTTAFPNTNYAVVVTGEDARSWTIESKAAGSFVINANSNTSLAGTTYWIATAYGET